jgi:SAM-dependent methyltransferase
MQPGEIPEPLRTLIPGHAGRVVLPDLLALAEREGILSRIRSLSPFTVEELCDVLSRELGFALESGNRRHMIRLFVELLAEMKWLRRDGGGDRWGVHAEKPPLGGMASGVSDDGEIRFLRRCLELVPGYLRGQAPPIGFDAGCAAAWEDFLGCAEFQACRTVLFDMMAAGAPPGARLLDLCHGPGWGIERAIARWPGVRISAIDFTDAFSETARRRAGEAQARWGGREDALQAPVEWFGPDAWTGLGAPLPFREGAFDAVLFGCGDPYIPPGSREAVYADLSRVLKPGGCLGILTRGRPDPERRHVAARTLRITALIHDFSESVCAGWRGFADVGENLRLFERLGFREGAPGCGGMAFFGSSLWFMRKG